jgi:hypothetical protein
VPGTSRTSSRLSGFPSHELDAAPSAEDTTILQSLMNAGHADRVEFMG